MAFETKSTKNEITLHDKIGNVELTIEYKTEKGKKPEYISGRAEFSPPETPAPDTIILAPALSLSYDNNIKYFSVTHSNIDIAQIQPEIIAALIEGMKIVMK